MRRYAYLRHLRACAQWRWLYLCTFLKQTVQYRWWQDIITIIMLNIHMNLCYKNQFSGRNDYDRGVSLDSKLTKSSGGGILQANPWLDLDPLMHWIAQRSKEKFSRQCNHAMVELYGWSQWTARREAAWWPSSYQCHNAVNIAKEGRGLEKLLSRGVGLGILMRWVKS